MADTDLSTDFKLTPSLLEQLDKALIEQQAPKDGASDTVSFKEIAKHFRDLEAKMMNKYTELEAKEKAFKQEQSDSYKLLAEKEAAVAAKEKDMFDQIQVFLNTAVTALSEARANRVMPSVDTDITDAIENKVTSPLDETNECPEDVTFHQELTQFCEHMDTHGLLSFVTENKKYVTVLREELSDALKSSTDPGRLVLDSLDGFYPYPPDENNTNNNKDAAALQGMRRSCINLMEAMNAMLAKADVDPDHILSYEIKQQAKAIADEWRPKLAPDGIIDVSNGRSVEAQAFLQLLSTFKVVSEFDEDQLCKLVLAVSERRQAPELARSLGLAHKMPGVINELISRGKQISSVHFVHAFELVDRFPTVPLLKTYLRELRRKSQRKRIKAPHSESLLEELNDKELVALKDVINCVEKYGLKAEHPLEPLQRRVVQLERVKNDDPVQKMARQLERAKSDRKRPRESISRPPPHIRRASRSNRGGGSGARGPSSSYMAVNGRHAPAPAPLYMDRQPYAAPPQERYPHVDPYNYHAAAPPVPSQTAYNQPQHQHVYEQSAYYYKPDDRVDATAAPPVAPTAYSGYTPPPYQPYA